MKIKFFIIFLNCSLCQLSFALPDGFYKDESSVRFLKNKYDGYYTFEKYSGDLVVVYERRNNHTDILMGEV